MSAKPDSIKSIHYALFANFSIAIAKQVAAVFTGASAMMAETMRMGHKATVAVKFRMTETGSETELINAKNTVESGFRVAFPIAARLFFEPDNDDGVPL